MEFKLTPQPPAQRAPLHTGGFTLLELLAVIIILGVLMGAVGISLAPQYSRKIDSEMEQLAQLFTFADETAKLQHKNLRWYSESEVEGKNFRQYNFLYQTLNLTDNTREWRAPKNSPALATRSFRNAVYDIQITRKDNNLGLQTPNNPNNANILESRRTLYIDFSREEINPPFILHIQFGSGDAALWRAIQSNGLGSYRVIYDPIAATP